MDKEELICDKCHKPFKTGDTIYIMNLAMIRKDLCVACKDEVLAYLEGKLF